MAGCGIWHRLCLQLEPSGESAASVLFPFFLSRLESEQDRKKGKEQEGGIAFDG